MVSDIHPSPVWLATVTNAVQPAFNAHGAPCARQSVSTKIARAQADGWHSLIRSGSIAGRHRRVITDKTQRRGSPGGSRLQPLLAGAHAIVAQLLDDAWPAVSTLRLKRKLP